MPILTHKHTCDPNRSRQGRFLLMKVSGIDIERQNCFFRGFCKQQTKNTVYDSVINPAAIFKPYQLSIAVKINNTVSCINGYLFLLCDLEILFSESGSNYLKRSYCGKIYHAICHFNHL